jgi:uncharacterized protein YndB with AHSA1/START domain
MSDLDGEFICDLTIKAPATRVYEALTTARALSLWWDHPIDHDLVVGSTAELPLGAGCLMRIHVDELLHPSRVSWTCVGGVPEWEQSTLRFELEEQPRTTLLRFGHRGWRWRVPGGQLAACGFSWPGHLLRLRTLAGVPRGRNSVRTERRS